MFWFSIGIGLLSLTLFASDTSHAVTYSQSIHRWQRARDARLRDPNGWLTLVGLFWLHPGANTVGSAQSNDLVLPKGSIPPLLGRLTRDNGRVTFTNLWGPSVTVNRKPAPSEVSLSYDEDKPDVVRYGTVSFFVIKRGDKLGVRAKDSQSPTLKNFTGVKDYPVNPAFRFDAKFVSNPQKTKFLNILGQTEEDDSPGYVEFRYQGRQYRLRPTTEDNELFFVFRDPTSKTTTYQPGRFLKTPMPVNGKVDLDFNKAYNPPCAFTPYATCPLPPKENVLPFPIEAGELRYSKGHQD
jgi:uncharacterized protein (DUF1684 family)